MADKKITIEELPEPISDQDMLLHNIIDGTPDIEDLIPNSRQEVYLKYIALNGGSGGGGGGGTDVNIVQTTGQSTTSVMSQKAVTDNLNTKIDIVDGKGLSTEDFTTEYKDKLDNIPNNLDNLGTAAYCNTGVNEGNVPIINSSGKLDNSVIPSLAITDTFVAENEEEMLNLQGAEKGDICIRTDENKTYILDETPKKYSRSKARTTLSDWVELQTPTDEVQSVNGQKGNVVLSAGDVDAYTKTEIDGKLPNIVQTTGQSTTSVMSQRAVTNNTCFGNLATTHSMSAISLGYGAQANTFDTIAIGTEAQANKQYSIALGSRSVANENSVLSVGDGSNNANIGTRRIVNVKDPVNDQDAATKNYVDIKVAEAGGSGVTIVQEKGTSETDVMSQKAVTDNIPTKTSQLENDSKYVSNNATIDTSTAIGDRSTATGASCVSFGYLSNASENFSSAFGYNSQAGYCSTSVGYFAKTPSSYGTAIGRSSQSIGDYSVAIGSNSIAEEAKVVSVGDGSTNSTYGTRRIVNVTDPVNDQDAATKKYVDAKVSEAGGGSSVTVVQETGQSETAVMSQNSCTNSFAAKSHNHSASDLTSGVLSVSRGGTGASTAEQARKNLNVPYLPSSYYEGDLNNLTDTGFYTISYSGTTNAPPTKNVTPEWLLMVISSNSTSLNVGTFQICSEIFATKQTSVWVRKCDGISSSNWTEWENINYNSDVNLVRSISEDINLYISPSGNDTTGDGSSSSPYATMKKALSLLSGKMINSVVSIYVMDGTYDESLDLIGLYGSGKVRILGHSLGRGSFTSCRIDYNALRMLEIHDMDIGSGTMYVRENSCYINLCGINFTGTSISLSTSNVMISRCNFSNATTAISAYPRGGAGGRGYDGVGKVVLKDTNTFTSVTTAVSVSGGCMLIQSTLPTLNGAVLKKSTGGMIIYPNGTFNEN